MRSNSREIELLDGRGRPAEDEAGKTLRLGRMLLGDLRRELAEAERENKERANSSGSYFNTAALFDQFPAVPYNSSTVSGPITLSVANNYVPISLNRILLSYAYMTQGFLRTVVKEPVDDAFHGGFEFTAGKELDSDDLKLLMRVMKRQRRRSEVKASRLSIGAKVQYNAGNDLQRSDMSAIKHVGYWGRLFGGSGAIINVDQDFRKELDVEGINEGTPLEFIPADRWELTLGSTNIFADNLPCPFNYYGYPLNGSRVMKFLWNEAPSFIRLRLQGWGMSEVEHCIRPINAFLKFENLIFELLDQAKVDVYKLANFASTKLARGANEKVLRTMEVVNQVKNYHNAIVLDEKDDYQQKQLTFGGLAEIRQQGRLDLAAALRFPLNKLFGDSATGFGGGQDALENYNAQVQTFRDEIEPIVIGVGELRCQQLFGFVPDSLEVKWRPLREMSGTDQETVLTQRSARALSWFQSGLLTGKEASEQARKDGVLTEDTEIMNGTRQVMPSMLMDDQLERDKLAVAGESAAGDGPGNKAPGSTQGSRAAGEE